MRSQERDEVRGSVPQRLRGAAVLTLLIVVVVLAVAHLLDEPSSSLQTSASATAVRVVRGAGDGPPAFASPTEVRRGAAPTLPVREEYERLGLPAPLPPPAEPVERVALGASGLSGQSVPGVDSPYVTSAPTVPTVPRTTIAELTQFLQLEVRRTGATAAPPPGSTTPTTATATTPSVVVAGVTRQQETAAATGGPLPRTGAGRWLRLTAAIGLLLSVTGVLLVVVARRRREFAASGRT